MRRIACRSLTIAVLLCSGARAEGVLIGRPTVVDGDTLHLHGTVIGLAGVAAPGPDQVCHGKDGRVLHCGRQAAAALSERIGAAVIACERRGFDVFQRTLAICRLDGEDLNAWMVASGLAVSERFSDASYFGHETRAWARRIGLWAGVFEDPTGRQRGGHRVAADPPVAIGQVEPPRRTDGAPALKLTRLAR